MNTERQDEWLVITVSKPAHWRYDYVITILI